MADEKEKETEKKEGEEELSEEELNDVAGGAGIAAQKRMVAKKAVVGVGGAAAVFARSEYKGIPSGGGEQSNPSGQ
jgi:hypothetical protein